MGELLKKLIVRDYENNVMKQSRDSSICHSYSFISKHCIQNALQNFHEYSHSKITTYVNSITVVTDVMLFIVSACVHTT